MKQLFFISLTILISSMSWAHNKRSSLDFVQNKTQWNENVLFRACLPDGGSVYLENDGFTFAFLQPDAFSKLHDLQFATREEQKAFSVPGHAWKLNLINSLENAVVGEKKQSYYHNYFLGQDQSTWSSHVGVFDMINYSEVYEGIDLKVYSKNQNFKYDFIVSPFADPSLISFDYDGLEDYWLKDGNLVLKSSIGEFIESKPFAYQLIDGKLTEVECLYQLEKGIINYSFPKGYDQSLKLIIDPELIASTLSGTTGFSSNYGHSAAFDLEGNIFTGCVASGSEYPVTLGAFDQTYGGGTWDIGISKLNPEGTDLFWATFIGGEDSDYPHSLVSNNAGELYVYGTTASPDFPVTDDAVQTTHGNGNDNFEYDIIVSHLEFDGSGLIGSTFLGGSGTDGQNANAANYGDNYRGEIIIDYDNNPIITSGSQSTDFPVLANAYQSTNGGAQDVVIVKLTPDLSELLVSTYYGGTDNDMGYGLRTTPDGEIIIGGSASLDLTITADAYQTEFIGDVNIGDWGGTELDGFVAKFNAEGSSLIASTYHGTESKDQVFFLDLDIDNNIFVYGQGGGDMPVTEGVYENANSGQFITKFSNDLTEVLVGTVVGTGSGFTDFVPDAFLVDNCDNIYISAYNATGNLETTDDALFSNGGFYLAVYEEDLTDIVFGTFYTEDHVDGGTSRFDKNGIVYQGVCSGGGFSTTADAWATDQTTGWDIGIFKIDFDASGVNAAVAQNDLTGCSPVEIDFQNFSVGEEFEWDFGNGETSTEFEPSILYDTPGVYDVSLIAKDSLSCNLADTVALQIVVNSPQNVLAEFDATQTDCDLLTVETTNESSPGNFEYEWDFGDGTTSGQENPSHNYENTGNYEITLVVNDIFCNTSDTYSQEIIISQEVIAQINNQDLLGCAPFTLDFDSEAIGSSVSTWNFGDGSPITVGDNISHEFTESGVYSVTLTVEVDGAGSCSGIDETTILIDVLDAPVVSLGPDSRICQDSIVLNALNPDSEYLWQDGSTSQTFTAYESGVYAVEVNNGACSSMGTIEIDLVTGLSHVESLIPNVFSPNRDGKNDLFRLDNEQDLSGSMKIYNRWGKLVHEDLGTGISWDGRIDGEEATAGVYFYIIEVFPKCNQVTDSEHNGSVQLMR